MNRSILIVVYFFLPVGAFAQEAITMEQTISFLENKMNDRCKFDVKNGGKLIIRFYRNGSEYRQDVIFLNDMAADNVKYDADAKAVLIHCSEQEPECVMRKVYKDKIKKFYNRVNFPFDITETASKSIIEAFEHMILLSQDPKHERTEPFEQ